MGYLHPQGEIHLLGPGLAVSCPGLCFFNTHRTILTHVRAACTGNDNAVDMQCQVKSVPNLLSGRFFDHVRNYEICKLITC